MEWSITPGDGPAAVSLLGVEVWGGMMCGMRGEVVAVSSGMEQVPVPRRSAREALDEQARRKGARPLRSAEELRNDEVWESDEELAEFLAYLEVARQPGSA